MSVVLGLILNHPLKSLGFQNSSKTTNENSADTSPPPIKVFLGNGIRRQIPAWNQFFNSNSSLNINEIEEVKIFLQKNKGVFNLSDSKIHSKLTADSFSTLGLELVSDLIVGDRRFLRFQQTIKRKIRNKPYEIPVQGASLVAIFVNGYLHSLNSSLIEVPSLSPVMHNPGIQFNVTDQELLFFMEHLKLNERSRNNLKKYLINVIAKRSGLDLNFDQILNKDISEQRTGLNLFFSQLPRLSTARLLIDMARHKQLAFVRHDNQWMFQVTGFFGLPIQFDIEIPQNINQRLILKNIRELNHSATSIRYFQSPLYPNGQKTAVPISGFETVVTRFQQVIQYFSEHFGWNGFSGKNKSDQVDIHTKIRTARFKQNAAWIPTEKVFLVGVGGDLISNLEDSVSVLGHEYAHALVQSSSGLVYKGESGALNEHFADLQGISIAAEQSNKGKFDFTIGREVLNPNIRMQMEKLIPSIQNQHQYSENEIQTFELNKIGLRHLYSADLSYFPQYENNAKAKLAYPSLCQPSVANDNCGVHSMSGIPNKASAMIIAKLGFAETKDLFFNTVIYRLNQNASFLDYLEQLYEECLQQPKLISQCEIIQTSFANVGVVKDQIETSTELSSALTPNNLTTTNNPKTLGTNNPLKFCGPIEKGPFGKITIHDGKFNPEMRSINSAVTTRGDYENLVNSNCGCVTGPMILLPEKSGKVTAIITQVLNFENRSDYCDKQVSPFQENLNNKNIGKIENQTSSDVYPERFCGWVKISTRTRNITIVDNMYDVSILTVGSDVTQGSFESLYRHQCACVQGSVSQSRNYQNRLYNYFVQIQNGGIQIQPIENCSHIQWR